MEVNHSQNQDQDNQKVAKVTIEDLLKLKRLEKPSEAFWNRFDRELQEKTWEALITKVPLGERLQRIWRVALMPVAAACLFVVGFFFYQEIGRELRMQETLNEGGTILVAIDESNPVVETENPFGANKLEGMSGTKNYVRKVWALEEETPEARRVFTHRALYPNIKNKGVQYIAASPYALRAVSKNNLVL